jgi:hypothetical protein
MEDKSKNNVSNTNDKFVFNMIKITISKQNAPRLHELVRDLLRINAIEKHDAEMLFAAAEIL